MGSESKDRLPFSVVRSSRATLVEQVVEGLRRCILTGFYKPGDVLPTTRDLAKMLGVSRIVTRAAVQELTKAELINPKPSVGCVVLGRGGKLWKGNILFVSRSNGRVYYDSIFTATLRTQLVKAGWLVTFVTATEELDGNVDTSELEMHLNHPVALAIVLFGNAAAERVLSRSGVPFVTTGDGAACRLKGCVGRVRYDRSAAVAEFANAAKMAGVRTVLQVGWENFNDVGSALKAAGIRTAKWNISVQHGRGMPAAVSQSGYDAFSKWVRRIARSGNARNSGGVPDLVYFSDDYVCKGALAALAAADVRVPGGLRIVTWSNIGNDFFFGAEPSRMEMDPENDAKKVSSAIIALLNGESVAFPIVLGPTFRKAAML